MGAAGGLGYAAIHRALRLKAGNKAPVAVWRPILAGAAVGALLGGMSAYKMRNTATNMQAWRYHKSAHVNPKYAGLLKLAAPGRGLRIAQTIANEGSYWIPGVGTARMGVDAVGSFGRGIGNLAHGRWKKGLAGVGGGLANTLFALASLIPGGALVGRGAKALRLAGRLGKGARGARAMHRAGRLGRTMSRIPGAGRLAQRMGSRGIGALERAGGHMLTTGRRFGGLKGMLGGMGLGIGAGMLEGLPAARPGQVISRGLAAQGVNRFRGLYNRLTAPRASVQPFYGMPTFRPS
jgi:hypothetical protein